MNEVLFTYCTGDNSKEDILLCFSSTGEEMWKAPLGKIAKFGEKTIPDDYRIRGIDCKDIDYDGNLEVIVLINHQQAFPGRAVIYDSSGNQLGEFWNPGHLYDYGFFDLNNNGTDEIILAGYNDEWEKYCLAILDFMKLATSPQDIDRYTYKSSERDKCYAYILLPNADMPIQLSVPETFHRLVLRQNPESRITLESLMNYTLDSELELKTIEFSQRLITEYLFLRQASVVFHK